MSAKSASDGAAPHATQSGKTSGKEFVVTRTLDAPRHVVWKAWTQLEHLKRWFGPKGFTIEKATLDFRPGGIFHYAMRSPDGQVMWGKWTFVEIVPEEKLVVIVAFSDEDKGIGRHPMSPTWPRETLGTQTFTEENGKTILTIRWLAYNATDVETETFDSNAESMRMGWAGTFERLVEHLDGMEK